MIFKIGRIYSESLICTAFQILFSQIIRILELFLRSVASYFFKKLLCLQRKTALLLSRN